jgi:general stress protein YciG
MAKEVPNVPQLRSNSEIWREKMRGMLGSDEAVSDYMRKIGSAGGKKSRGGGYAANPDKAKESGKKSGRVRRARKGAK